MFATSDAHWSSVFLLYSFRFLGSSNIQKSEAFEESKEGEALDQEETHQDHDDDDESLQEEVGCGC